MECTKKWEKSGFLTVLLAFTVMLLCVPSYGQIPSTVLEIEVNTELDVGTGKDMEQILYAEYYRVDVFGTLNSYPGAYIEAIVMVWPDSTVNIYGLDFGFIGYLNILSAETLDEEDPVVTVHGTNFTLSGASEGTSFDDASNPTKIVVPGGGGDGTLHWTYEEINYSIYFFSLTDIQLGGSPEQKLNGLITFILGEVPENIAPELVVSLLAKVDADLAALARGNPNDAKVAMNDLKALVNQVEAQTDKKISQEAATGVIQRANDIILVLSSL